MTSIRPAARSTGALAARHVSPPTLQKRPLAAALGAAARDLLKNSDGNEVTISRYKASPAQLSTFSKDAARFKEFLYKAGVGKPPDEPYQEHSVKRFTGASISKAIFDF